MATFGLYWKWAPTDRPAFFWVFVYTDGLIKMFDCFEHAAEIGVPPTWFEEQLMARAEAGERLRVRMPQRFFRVIHLPPETVSAIRTLNPQLAYCTAHCRTPEMRRLARKIDAAIAKAWT